jgi:hypothetical protein
MPTNTSDHAPLKLTITKPQRVPRTFHFEKYWMQFQKVNDLIVETWNSIADSTNIASTILRKLNRVRQVLRKWAGDKFKNQNQKLNNSKFYVQLLDRTQEVRVLTT